VQESLTNVAKHAGAGKVAIAVEMGPASVDIEVRDDGVGFDPASPAAGFGLVGMRERAELAHGTLDVEAGPGAGTIVRAHIPLEAEDGTLSAASGPAA